MKTRFAILLLFVFCLPLTGCLTTRAQLRGQGAQQPADSNRTVVTPEVRKANEMARLDEHDEQMRMLNGKIEEMENRLSMINAGQQGQADQERRDREQLDLRFKAYEEELKKLGQQMTMLAEDLRGLRARTEKASGTKGDTFQAAESAFSQKEWQQAIVAYDSYRKANPKGKKYSTATLKIGMAFQEMKFKDEAKAFFEEVIAKFPKSKDAKTAEQRLKSLK